MLLGVALTNGCTFGFTFYTRCLCQTIQSLLNTLNPLNPPCYLLSTNKEAFFLLAHTCKSKHSRFIFDLIQTLPKCTKLRHIVYP